MIPDNSKSCNGAAHINKGHDILAKNIVEVVMKNDIRASFRCLPFLLVATGERARRGCRRGRGARESLAGSVQGRVVCSLRLSFARHGCMVELGSLGVAFTLHRPWIKAHTDKDGPPSVFNDADLVRLVLFASEAKREKFLFSPLWDCCPSCRCVRRLQSSFPADGLTIAGGGLSSSSVRADGTADILSMISMRPEWSMARILAAYPRSWSSRTRQRVDFQRHWRSLGAAGVDKDSRDESGCACVFMYSQGVFHKIAWMYCLLY